MPNTPNIQVETTQLLEQSIQEALKTVIPDAPQPVIEIPNADGMKLVLKGSPEAAERNPHDIVKEVEHLGTTYLVCNA